MKGHMTTAGHLAYVIALARTGAVDRAWAELSTVEPAARHGAAGLSVMARLLKDKAIRATGEERQRLYEESAEAYKRSAAEGRRTYGLINAATLSLLAGNPVLAAGCAGQVLHALASHPDEPESPYYRAATQAEALLLLDRMDEAAAAFTEAVALAPRAWEDHASTLRQFGLILNAQGRDATWLDGHRPPQSLHFGGHMSFDARKGRRPHLDDRIHAALEEEKVGFGFGALGAGADIIVAEALLERGAELHAVLPGGREAFAAVSVEPFGKAWRRRFEAVLERAETVRTVRPIGVQLDWTTIGLGDEIAMGAAAMNARRLESSALQLLVVAEDDPHSDLYLRWAEKGWRQRIVTPLGEALPAKNRLPVPFARHERLALLAVALGAGEEVEVQLAQLRDRLGGLAVPAVPPYFTGRQLMVAYADIAEAARAATALVVVGVGVGGHYGIVDPIADPFSGKPRLIGEAAALADAAAASAAAGSVCVTGDFAAALSASRESGIYAELIGELEARDGGGPIELYALKPRPV
ncbi:MAG: hypothetical protein JWO81_526 [Alphaproteobacteria bacterium]|nr:hypothetical protein [Alphaproteobacteria bacterium]